MKGWEVGGMRRREEEVEDSWSSDPPPGHESELSRREWGRRKTERTHSGNLKWLSLAKARGRCERNGDSSPARPCEEPSV